jgi:hypothetical protein
VSEERKPVTYALLLFSLIAMIIMFRRPKEAVITPKPQASVITTTDVIVGETAELLRVIPIPIDEMINLTTTAELRFYINLNALTTATISDSMSYLLIKVLNALTTATISDSLSYAKVRQISLSETVNATSSAELYRVRGISVSETLIGLSQALITLGISLNASTNASISEAVSKTLTKNISETVNATSSATITTIEQPIYTY